MLRRSMQRSSLPGKDSEVDFENYVAEGTDSRMIESWENEQFRVVRIGKPADERSE